MKFSRRHYVTFVMIFGIVIATSSRVMSDSIIVLEHKEAFIVYSTTKGVTLNGSISGYNLSEGNLIQVLWVAEEDPLLVPPAILLLTENQWALYSHATGPIPPWNYLVKEIEWASDFQYYIASNGTYFVVIDNINWPAYGWTGPTLNITSYDAVTIISEEPYPPPEPVGGKTLPINKMTIESELPVLWIWLSTILLPLVAIAVFVKLKKKTRMHVRKQNGSR